MICGKFYRIMRIINIYGKLKSSKRKYYLYNHKQWFFQYKFSMRCIIYRKN